MQEQAFKFKKWDISTVPDNAVVTIIGKRRSGKSKLIIDIMYQKQNSIPFWRVMSETETLNHDFEGIVPPQFISNELDPAEIERLCLRQETIKNLKFQAGNMNMPELTKGLPKNHNLGLVVDDCFSNPNVWKDKRVNKLFVNGRHFDMLLLYGMQNPKGVLPGQRANSDYVVFFREGNPSQRKKIFSEYCESIEAIFPNYKRFSQIFAEITRGFKCMVIDMNNITNKPEESVMYYEANLYPTSMDQKIPIAPKLWKIHRRSYDPMAALWSKSNVILEEDPKNQQTFFEDE